MEMAKRYLVDYSDQAVYARLLTKAGGDPSLVSLDDYWTWQDFDTLEEATAFADSQPMSSFVRDEEQDGAIVYET